MLTIKNNREICLGTEFRHKDELYRFCLTQLGTEKENTEKCLCKWRSFKTRTPLRVQKKNKGNRLISNFCLALFFLFKFISN